ncbi:hypothetical protein EVAR_16118_1 [Eumeta japonica]|uniref:Uncharacterized protein n=1 Tax=Eumeta variegata TaxID=151549 RepID=A0A4C1UK43_EUMVA|nr:hypothetical protein EVAR_16118_1 [Eumeta japonica]
MIEKVGNQGECFQCNVLTKQFTCRLCAAAVSLLLGPIGRWSGREIDASQAERLARSCLSVACSALSLARSAQMERDNKISNMAQNSSSLLDRYFKFMDVVNDPSIPPPRVYDPLSPTQLNDVKLIREVSAVLQKAKDDEELKKIRDAENEAEADDKKEENAEEDTEPKQE